MTAYPNMRKNQKNGGGWLHFLLLKKWSMADKRGAGSIFGKKKMIRN